MVLYSHLIVHVLLLSHLGSGYYFLMGLERSVMVTVASNHSCQQTTQVAEVGCYCTCSKRELKYVRVPFTFSRPSCLFDK